jgi:hypothetical protein
MVGGRERMNKFMMLGVLAGCLVTTTCGVDVTGPEMVGEWGGEHISLSVSLNGSTLEYDCAHGTIEESIEPDGSGNFSVTGIHVLEHGGPFRQDEPPDEHAARYEGWTNGDRMTITVILTDTGREIGTYRLRLGEPAQLFKCL